MVMVTQILLKLLSNDEAQICINPLLAWSQSLQQ